MGITISMCIWKKAILNKVARKVLTVNMARSFMRLFLVISLMTELWFHPKSTLGTAILWQDHGVSM